MRAISTNPTAIEAWIVAATRTVCPIDRSLARFSEIVRESSCSTGRCSTETTMNTADQSTATCPYCSLESSCEAIAK
jgi:hypothetical protein